MHIFVNLKDSRVNLCTWLVEAMVDLKLKEELEQVMASDAGLLAKWQKVQQKLLNANLAWYATLTCDQLAVHPCNRGGAGVSPLMVHKKGQEIAVNGADLSLLSGSVCFELNPSPSEKMKQLHFNKQLAEASDGMLAYTGAERYGTVAKSHTSQWVKAIQFGCKSNTSVAVDGALSRETMVRRDEQLAVMVEKGWQWLVVASVVEESLPNLPSLATLALHSTNSSYESINELELMSHLTMEAKRSGHNMDWDAMSQAICTGGPVASYSKTVGKFVQLYSGGEDYPLVHFLVAFAKHYTAALSFGQEYMSSVVNTQLQQNNLMPFTRLSLLCANLAAPSNKVVDGLARLLSKQDVEKLRGKKILPEVLKLEALLEQAWKDCKGQDHMFTVKIFGKLCVRSVLAVLGKSKQGPENKDMTLEESKARFYKEFSEKDLHKLQAEAKAEAAPPKGNKPVICLNNIIGKPVNFFGFLGSFVA